MTNRSEGIANLEIEGEGNGNEEKLGNEFDFTKAIMGGIDKKPDKKTDIRVGINVEGGDGYEIPLDGERGNTPNKMFRVEATGTDDEFERKLAEINLSPTIRRIIKKPASFRPSVERLEDIEV